MELIMGKDVDALYIRFSDARVAGGRELDDRRHLDLDGDGGFIGIEFLNVSEGVDLVIPGHDTGDIVSVLQRNNVKIFTA